MSTDSNKTLKLTSLSENLPGFELNSWSQLAGLAPEVAWDSMSARVEMPEWP